MSVTEYIEKLKEWTKDIGPENEVQVSPSRLLMAYDSNYWKELVTHFNENKKLIEIFFKGDNN
jgi:hypothetical protein